MITTTSPRTFRWDRGLTAMLHRTRVRLTSWVRGTFAFFSLSDRRAAQECQRSIFVAICICAFSSLSTNQRPRFSPALAWRVTGAIQIRRVACFSASAPRTSRRRAPRSLARTRSRRRTHTPERTFTSTSWRTSSRSRRRSRRTATTSPTRRRRRSSASPSAASSANQRTSSRSRGTRSAPPTR